MTEASYIRNLHDQMFTLATNHPAWSNTIARGIVSHCITYLRCVADSMEQRAKIEHLEQLLRDHHMNAGAPTDAQK